MRQAEDISSYLSLNASGCVACARPAAANVEILPTSPGSRYRYAIRDEAGRVVLSSGRRVGPVPDLIANGTAFEPTTYKSYGETAHTIGAAFRTDARQWNARPTQVEQTAPLVESINAAVFNEFFVPTAAGSEYQFLLALLAVSAWTVETGACAAARILRARREHQSRKLGRCACRKPACRKRSGPLVRAINSALDRLDDGLTRQREFNANAAHQLRTPLAVLVANIDTMNDKAAAGKLRYDVDLMSRIVTQLLLVAKLETLNISLDEQVDLCSVAHEVAENLGPIAVAMHKTLEIDEPAGPVGHLRQSLCRHSCCDRQPHQERAQSHPGRRTRAHPA